MSPICRSLGTRESNGDEEERVGKERNAENQVSFSADRRENQGARRLAGQDAQPAAYPGQGSRSRSRRGVEVARGSGVVARRIDLHRRDLQERREDDLRQRGGSEGSFAPLQLQPRREHEACHRLPRGREDQRGGIEDSRSRRRDPEQVEGQKLIDGNHRVGICGWRQYEARRGRAKAKARRASRASAARKPAAKAKKTTNAGTKSSPKAAATVKPGASEAKPIKVRKGEKVVLLSGG